MTVDEYIAYLESDDVWPLGRVPSCKVDDAVAGVIAEVKRLRAENERLRTVKVARGHRVVFPDGVVFDRDEPRYSTEAVDALLQVIGWEVGVREIYEAAQRVRASREPRL